VSLILYEQLYDIEITEYTNTLNSCRNSILFPDIKPHKFIKFQSYL